MPLLLAYSADINATPEDIYAVMTDPSRFGEWMPNFVRVDDLSPGVKGVGQSWREVRKMYGQEAGEVFEVTAAEPPRMVEFYCDGTKGASKRGYYRFKYTLTPSGNSTHLACDGEIGMGGGFAEFMGGLMLGVMKKMLKKDMACMKSYIETNKG